MIKKIYVTNSFSVNMFTENVVETCIDFRKTTVQEVKNILAFDEETFRFEKSVEIESVIGHNDTANIVSSILDYQLSCKRKSIELDWGVLIIIAQYTGPRLQEGTKELPEGADIQFWLAYQIQV